MLWKSQLCQQFYVTNTILATSPIAVLKQKNRRSAFNFIFQPNWNVIVECFKIIFIKFKYNFHNITWNILKPFFCRLWCCFRRFEILSRMMIYSFKVDLQCFLLPNLKWINPNTRWPRLQWETISQKSLISFNSRLWYIQSWYQQFQIFIKSLQLTNEIEIHATNAAQRRNRSPMFIGTRTARSYPIYKFFKTHPQAFNAIMINFHFHD